MIMFEIVRWKNFLSTGNNTTEIQLNKTKSTLIVGHNGAGKSTMLDAISFGLFGKPHRSITKPQLLNSVNNKNCLVEVEFSSGKNKYKIVRGIKPSIFEIWKNGTMINQSSHAKEYQKILEQNILKLNHKSFHQIVVLGSGSFIPFMQLPGGHRREVIEDLLDINVFSRMNQLCKEQYSIIKESLRTNQYELDINNNRIDTQKKYIKDVKILTEQNLASKEAKISEHNTEIESLEKENTSLAAEIDSKQGPIESRLNELHDKKQSLLQYNSTFRSQMNNITKEAKFYEDNESCPTCSQDIDEILRNEKLSSAKAKAKELKSAMDSASLESTAVEQSIEQVTADLTDIREKQQIIHSNSRQISSLRVQIDSIKGELETIVSSSPFIESI